MDCFLDCGLARLVLARWLMRYAFAAQLGTHHLMILLEIVASKSLIPPAGAAGRVVSSIETFAVAAPAAIVPAGRPAREHSSALIKPAGARQVAGRANSVGQQGVKVASEALIRFRDRRAF